MKGLTVFAKIYVGFQGPSGLPSFWSVPVDSTLLKPTQYIEILKEEML